MASGKFFRPVGRMARLDERQTVQKPRVSDSAHKTEPQVIFQEMPLDIHNHRQKLWLGASIWSSPAHICFDVSTELEASGCLLTPAKYSFFSESGSPPEPEL